MSGSATLGTEQAVLGHTLGFAAMAMPAQVFVALDLAAPATPPTETAVGTEVMGVGYARMPANFALVEGPSNIASNTTSIEFPIAGSAWGHIGYFELWDAQIGGNRLYLGQLLDPVAGTPLAVTVAVGDVMRFSAGTLGVQAASGVGTTGTGGAYLPLAGGTLTGPLLLAADPTQLLGAATMQYVNAHIGTGGGSGFLPIGGGTLTGALTLVGDAALALQPVTLQQLNAKFVGSPWLALSGGTLTGPLTLSGNAVGALQAVPLQQVLPLTGGTIGGNLVVSGSINSTGGAAFSGGNVTFTNSPVGLTATNGLQSFQFNFTSVPASYANDAAASAGGVPVGRFYRNGSVLMVRVT